MSFESAEQLPSDKPTSGKGRGPGRTPGSKSTQFKKGNREHEKSLQGRIKIGGRILKMPVASDQSEISRQARDNIKKAVPLLVKDCPPENLIYAVPLALAKAQLDQLLLTRTENVATGKELDSKELIAIMRELRAVGDALRKLTGAQPEEQTDNDSPLLLVAAESDTATVSQRDYASGALKDEIRDAEFRSDADSDPGGEGDQ